MMLQVRTLNFRLATPLVIDRAIIKWHFMPFRLFPSKQHSYRVYILFIGHKCQEVMKQIITTSHLRFVHSIGGLT